MYTQWAKVKVPKAEVHFFFFLNCCFDLLFFWSNHTACRILVPWPGIKPVSPAVDEQIPNTGPPGKSPEGHVTMCRAPILNTLEAFCGKLFLPPPPSRFTHAALSGLWKLLAAWPVAFLSWEHFSGYLICFLFVQHLSDERMGRRGKPLVRCRRRKLRTCPPSLWIPSRPHFLMSDPHGWRSQFPSCRSQKISF